MPDIFERIKKYNLPIGQYAVFGSGLLEVWGLRKAADLDIIVTPELYNKLKTEGWQEKQGHGFTMLCCDDANLTTVQSGPTDGTYHPDRIQLIRNAVFIRGIPFVRIEEVVACKKDYGRPKDREDIKMIEAYMKKAGSNLYSS